MEQCLAGRAGPAVAATDYVRGFAEQIRPWVPQDRTTSCWVPMAMVAQTRGRICGGISKSIVTMWPTPPCMGCIEQGDFASSNCWRPVKAWVWTLTASIR